MKKKYFILASLIGAISIFTSCSDQLDADYLFKDRMSTEKVFKSKDYSDEWLAGAYGFLADGTLADVSSKGFTPFCFSDDMYFGDREDRYKAWKNGEYAEDGLQNIGGVVWNICYKGIRQSSVYINNIDMNNEMTPEQITTGKAEARFLRATFYWKMLRLFGPIPLVTNETLDYTADYADLALPRNSYDECVEYITNELVLAAKDLPLRQGLLSIARPTRGAALATRAKVLLYAASPLMNGKGGDYTASIKDHKGRALISDTYDEAKWAKAAAAAKDVMELEGGTRYTLYTAPLKTSGTSSFPATIVPPHDAEFSDQEWPNGWKNIDPFESYRAIFNGTVLANDNPELIFTRGQNQSSEGLQTMVLHQMPNKGGGWNTHGMTQKQTDAYYMYDGTDAPGKDKEIGRGDGSNRASGYTSQADVDANKYKPLIAEVSMQYANREPRFYASVAYSGRVWNYAGTKEGDPKDEPAFYYRGSGEGYVNTMFWLRTGIGVAKFVHPDDSNKPDSKGIRNKVEPNIRYAEILLIYAEALNELQGSHTIPSWDGTESYTISRNVAEMKKGIQPIRIRAGVPDYLASEYASIGTFRAKLKRERQIELMGEGHRYYDLRRWMDAPVEESMPIYGCNPFAQANQRDLFYTIGIVPSLPTTFSRKMWFWPISQSELKRNKALTQNPGWTYAD